MERVCDQDSSQGEGVGVQFTFQVNSCCCHHLNCNPANDNNKCVTIKYYLHYLFVWNNGDISEVWKTKICQNHFFLSSDTTKLKICWARKRIRVRYRRRVKGGTVGVGGCSGRGDILRVKGPPKNISEDWQLSIPNCSVQNWVFN